MGLPRYPLISMSALVQGEPLPLMQQVIFPREVPLGPAREPLSPAVQERVRQFRELVAAFNRGRKP